MRRRLIGLVGVSFVALALSVLSYLPTLNLAPAHAYTNGRLMDDAIMDDMTPMDIRGFLQAHGPCLGDYMTSDYSYDGTTYSYAGSVPASMIIYKSSQQWGINPRVLIATLQKEESLVSGTSCDAWRYNSAMGYGCPDSGGCNPKYVGFTKQVLFGAWQLKFGEQRSQGRTSWDGDDSINYVGYMTRGTFKRCGTCTANFYDGNATIDGQTVFIETGATASLYSYTPHLGQSFPSIYEGWFGSVLSDTIGPIAYRLYNPINRHHYYTTKQTDRNFAKVAAGFRDDGAAFNVSATQITDTQPVYSMYNGRLNDHFYAFDGLDRYWALIYGGYKDDGVAFYAYPTAQSGTVAVSQLWNPNLGDHFYTTSETDKSYSLLYAGYLFNKISFYVPQ